jgi:jmjN domain/ARID/BRIGHT DNA binding domain
MPPPSKGLPPAEPLCLAPAPVYRPTLSQFQDPLAYIASIRSEAEPYGFCKVVPPKGWKPPFAIERRGFKFKTKVQSVHELQEKAHNPIVAQAFMDEYTRFMAGEGRPYKKAPTLNGVEVDLTRLYRLVTRKGGYEEVTEAKGWRTICRILQVGWQGCPGQCHLPVLPTLTAALLMVEDWGRR